MDKARIIMEISADILRVMKAVINSDIGINAKIKGGVNTLIGSKLEREASVETDGDFIYHLYLNDYVTYVNSGRKAGKKFPPVEPIVKWAERRGLPTDNSTIFLIRRAISRDGIKARPIVDKFFELMGDKWDEDWADKIFTIIIEDITNWFNE